MIREIPISDPLQFDPALRELLLRKTGDPTGLLASEAVAAEEISVVAKLVDPAVPVEGLAVVARFGRVVTGRVSLASIVAVRSHANVHSLKASKNYTPGLVYSVPEIHASPPVGSDLLPSGFTGAGIIVGVCDWGCDFAHANFRNPDGSTRLLSLWDQRGGRQVESPEPYGYGREWKSEQINEALAQADPYAALLYDPAQIDLTRSGTHGTHVLDIAAGNGSAPGASPGVAPKADLIFVHLKGADTPPEDNLGDSVRLLEAVSYVFDQAGDRPVVVNLSLGSTGGPHDATPLVIQGLDALLEEKSGCAIVLSAGNYYGANLHANGQIKPGEYVDLKWQVTPRQDEIAELEVWYSGSDTFSVELIDPLGRSLARVGLGNSSVIEDNAHVIASIYHRRSDPNNGDNQIDIFLWPDAMIGVWNVRLHGENVVDGRYHAWVERDDPLFQSRFTPDCATQSYTTGTICNGNHTIAVGAYDARESTHRLVPFSSAGPTRDERTKPDCSAPGAGIRAARSSRLRNGLREMDGLTVKSGTSMAAPHVTGVIALMFEAAGERRLGTEQTRQCLLETCRPSPPFDESERLRYGVGRVDAAAAVNAVRSKFGPQHAPVEDTITLAPEECEEPKEAVMPGHESFSPMAEVSEPSPEIIAAPTDEPCPCGSNHMPEPTSASTRLSDGQLAVALPRLLVEMGDHELRCTDTNGLPIYDSQQPLRFAPSNRTYTYENGRHNYHAANFVYNTAYEAGYNVPVYPPIGVGQAYHNLAATFEALADSRRDYFDRFFEVVARPGDHEPLPLQTGDILLRGPEPGADYGHLAIIADPTLRELQDTAFEKLDREDGKGVQCIDAGLTIHTLDERIGRAVTDADGRVLDNRMVLRFRDDAIDRPRLDEKLRHDPHFRQMLENVVQQCGFDLVPPQPSVVPEQMDAGHSEDLPGLTPSEMKALRITSAFETGRPLGYGGLVGDFDDQGLSFGLLQWNIGTGSLQPLLTEFARNHRERFDAVFGPDAERLRAILSRSHEEQLRFARSINDPDDARRRRIIQPWATYFQRLADDENFRQIQLNYVRQRMDAATRYARRFGLRSERGLAFMFDVVTQHGNAWIDSHRCRGCSTATRRQQIERHLAEIRERGTAPTERQILETITDVLANSVRVQYSENVRRRRMTIIEGRGVVHRTSFDLGRDYGLTDQPWEAQPLAPARPATSAPATAPAPTSVSRPATQPDTAAREIYLPEGGRNYTPLPNPRVFRCAPVSPGVIPATLLPTPTSTPDAAIEATLRHLGVEASALAAFRTDGGFEAIRPIAERFGAAALEELLGRLRYRPRQLVSPPHTYGSRLRQRLGTAAAQLLAPRLLLAIPGHFRELARRAPNAREAHALECTGWLLMSAIRDQIRTVSRQHWWVPPSPPFVIAFPSPLPALSQPVQQLILRENLTDDTLALDDYTARFNRWYAGSAGKTWRFETGIEWSNRGSGLSFYPETVSIPTVVDISREKQQINEVWAKLKAEPSADLTQCNNDRLSSLNLIRSASLQGVVLAYDFPLRPGGTTRTSLQVLRPLEPVFERIFSAIYQLGWNDLVFQTAGSFCFRRIRGSEQKLSNHGYGAAVDLNVVENPRTPGSVGVMDPRVVALFEAFHFRWGRCFSNMPDPHHFEYCGTACS